MKRPVPREAAAFRVRGAPHVTRTARRTGHGGRGGGPGDAGPAVVQGVVMFGPGRWEAAGRLLEPIAAAQCATFSHAQATDAGFDRQRIRRNVDSGRWVRLAPRVYGAPGVPMTWLRRLWVAHLQAGPDSVVSHGAAARLQRLGPIEGAPVDLIVATGRSRGVEGARIHRIADLAPPHVTTVRGLPTTSPARTIVDLAAHVSTTRLTTIMENAELERTCRLVDVATLFDDLRGSGKRGVLRLAECLDQLGPGEALPRSELETLADRAIELAGLPEPIREYPLPTTTDLSGFVDRCWPEAAFIVEADGRRWHTRRHQIALDHDRDIEAARRGFQTQRVIWERLRGDMENCAAALADIYRARMAIGAGEAARRLG